MEMKLKMVVREVIKPSSPSPKDHLQLSFLDLTSPGFYVLIIFFYKAKDQSPENISGTLKTSLSKTLSRFYPLAGRIEGNFINCNDEGAIFTEAHTDLHLQDFLRNINTNSLQVFCSTNTTQDSPTEWPLLGVKLTFFGSGSGVAVSVSVSHRICDAASLLTFVTEWAKTTVKEKSNDTIQFAETKICPSLPSQISSKDYNTFIETEKCVTNRFVFEPSKIIELKRKAASENVPLPTRVEAISALVLKCAGKASRSNSMVPRPILMYHAMDLRLRIPSTWDAIGNLQTPLYLKKDTESDLGICETVVAFRKAKQEANKMIQENLQSDTIGEYLMRVFENFELEVKEDIDLYIMSSWCKKPFYEVDFGFGSPIWIGSVFDNAMMDFVWLIDTKDGDGLEAWIGLPEQDMEVFIRDQDLLAYAVPNPPVLI